MPRKINEAFDKLVLNFLRNHTYSQTQAEFNISAMQIKRIKDRNGLLSCIVDNKKNICFICGEKPEGTFFSHKDGTIECCKHQETMKDQDFEVLIKKTPNVDHLFKSVSDKDSVSVSEPEYQEIDGIEEEEILMKNRIPQEVRDTLMRLSYNRHVCGKDRFLIRSWLNHETIY